MAATLPNVEIPMNVWVDLYAETGIAVGTQILVQNIGVCDIFLTASALQPAVSNANQIIKRSQFALNDVNDPGAWAYCQAGGAVNVRLP